MSGRQNKAELQAARAEAAAWLARLRSEDRTPEDERGFRAWLAESEAHRAAFEVTNAIFDMAGATDRRPAACNARQSSPFVTYGRGACGRINDAGSSSICAPEPLTPPGSANSTRFRWRTARSSAWTPILKSMFP